MTNKEQLWRDLGPDESPQAGDRFFSDRSWEVITSHWNKAVGQVAGWQRPVPTPAPCCGCAGLRATLLSDLTDLEATGGKDMFVGNYRRLSHVVANMRETLASQPPCSISVATEPRHDSADALPAVGGRRLDCSVATYERRALLALKTEQEKIAPDNALIAVLCDAVRLGREYCDAMSQPPCSGGKSEEREEAYAQLQARCYEGFPSASDGIFDALKEAEADRDQWQARAVEAEKQNAKLVSRFAELGELLGDPIGGDYACIDTAVTETILERDDLRARLATAQEELEKAQQREFGAQSAKETLLRLNEDLHSRIATLIADRDQWKALADSAKEQRDYWRERWYKESQPDGWTPLDPAAGGRAPTEQDADEHGYVAVRKSCDTSIRPWALALSGSWTHWHALPKFTQ